MQSCWIQWDFPSCLSSICAAVKGLKPWLILNSQISISFQLLAGSQKKHHVCCPRSLSGPLNPVWCGGTCVFVCRLLYCLHCMEQVSYFHADSPSLIHTGQHNMWWTNERVFLMRIYSAAFITFSDLLCEVMSSWTSRCLYFLAPL